MFTRFALRLIVVVGALGCAGVAMGQDTVHKYLSDTAQQVKATSDPVAKRAILSQSLSDMTAAITRVKDSSLTSEAADLSLDRIQATLQEKSDELAGTNGLERVPDAQLNAFSTYIVQDMEQADRTISISLVAALLIVIIIILIA